MKPLFEHVAALQEVPPELSSPHPLPMLCTTCEDPIYVPRKDRHGLVVCADCEEIGRALAAYVHTERLAVIRARAVLAREGIAGYGAERGAQ